MRKTVSPDFPPLNILSTFPVIVPFVEVNTKSAFSFIINSGIVRLISCAVNLLILRAILLRAISIYYLY